MYTLISFMIVRIRSFPPFNRVRDQMETKNNNNNEKEENKKQKPTKKKEQNEK